MIPYSVPPHLKIAVRDYTILDLGVDVEELRNNWKRCNHDYRLWVYNKTDKRDKFGHPKRQCFMAPGKEHFCFYTHFSGRWMCSVVDGASTYLDGHITRSVGRKADLRVRESRLGKNIYIEHSKPLPWSGRYTEVAPFLRLKWSFDILNRFVSETGPTPSQPDVARAAQIYVIHLAEAARFDSLFLENIYKYFLNTEHVGEDAIKKAQNWSVSCKDARKALDENEPVNDQIKMRAKGIFEDVRLIHRPNAGHGFFQLEKMPIQLGPDGPIFPEEDADAGGGAGNNNQGGGARGGERRERRRGRDQGPQDQGTSQDTSFLIEHFLPFEDDHQGKRSEHVEPTKNEINADAWLTVAVNEQEEAHRIIKTKGAEAEWLTVATNEKTDAHKIIQIEGTEYQTKDNLSSPSVASWGQAIMDRLRDSVLGFSVNVPCSLVEDAIREQCGKPESVLLEPECHALPWFIGEQVANPLPLRPQQLDVVFETKNKDNVFPNVVASARYEAPLGNASDAFRKQSYTRFQNQAYAFDGEAEAVLAKSEATDEGIRMVLEFWKTEGSTEAAGLRIAKHIRALASLAKNANTMLLLDEARNPSATTDQTLKKHKHARRSCLTSGRSRQVVEAEEENGFADVPNKAGEMLVFLSVQNHDSLFTATPQPKLVV